jgi:hypothetical protein
VSILSGVSLFAIVMLVAAVLLIGALELPRLAPRFGVDGRRSRERAKRKNKLKVVPSDPDDDFIRAVERDLAALPTIDDR